MELLIYNLVADLDEPLEMNFIKKHVIENLKDLKQDERFKSLDKTKFKKIACGRIFGPPSFLNMAQRCYLLLKILYGKRKKI